MKTNMNINSLKTYDQLREALGKQELDVYWAAICYPGKTRRELATKLRETTGNQLWQSSTVSGRVNKLVEAELIEDRQGGEVCSESGKPAGRLYVTKAFPRHGSSLTLELYA